MSCCSVTRRRALTRGLLGLLALVCAPLAAIPPPTAALPWLLELPPEKAAQLRHLIEAGARTGEQPASWGVTVVDGQTDLAATPAAPAPALTAAQAALATAAQARLTDLPPALRPWVPWAAQAASAALLCPWRYDGSATDCAWPEALTLDVTEHGAIFESRWTVHAASWLPLPGAAGAWPEGVRINGEAVGVVDRDGVPMVLIPADARPTLTVSGRLAWLERPAVVQLPTPSGPRSLTVAGRPVTADQVDAAGRLWLAAPPPPPPPPVQLAVTRELAAGHPPLLTTLIDLTSTGAPGALRFAPLLPAGFVPVRVSGPLPAQLDAQGGLTVQARPGQWRLTVVARATTPLAALTVPALPPPWPARETWAWRAAAAGDLTPAPAAEPPVGAVSLRAGERVPLPPPAAAARDVLTLDRTAWLDFSGAALTLADTLSGVLAAPTRVTAAPALPVTQHTLNGVPLAGPGDLTAPGGPLTLVATREVALARPAAWGAWPLTLPEAGWDPAPLASSTQLHLPPGWTLVTARGAALAPGGLADWTPLALFLLLGSAGIIGALHGRGLGLLALVALGLTWQLPGGLPLLWPAVAVAGALLARWRPGSTGTTRLMTALLALWLVAQVAPGVSHYARAAAAPALVSGVQVVAADDPTAGPRHWRSQPVVVHGARAAADLYLLAPPATRLLDALRALLLLTLGGWLAWRIAGRRNRPPAPARAAGPLLGVALVLGAGGAGAQPGPAVPDSALLETLQRALGAPPACAPHCASLASVIVAVTRPATGPARLTLTAQVQAASATSVPLPGRQAGWWPDAATVDETPTGFRDTPEQTWIPVPAGSVTVVLEGPLADGTDLPLRFPLPPARLLAGPTDGWRLEGLSSAGTPGAAVTLGWAPTAPAADTRLTPLAQIARDLRFGPQGQLTTRVTCQAAMATTVAVPRWPDGAADLVTVACGPDQPAVQWTAPLPAAPTLTLTAPLTPELHEQWSVAVDPAWQVTASGLALAPPAYHATRRWYPAPGARLDLAVTPPPPATPPPLAIDAAQLTSTPGPHASHHQLMLTLRAATALTHYLRLPRRATAITVAGAPVPAATLAAVPLAVAPGVHTLHVAWDEPHPPGAVYRLPTLDLGSAAHNAQTRVSVPPTRWALWATWGDAHLGPVVPLWGLLLLAAGGALAARRLPGWPLGAGAGLLLAVGLTQAPAPFALALGLLVLLAPGRPRPGRLAADLWWLAAAGMLLAAAVGIYQGLTGSPQTYIGGAGSSATLLHWYQTGATTLGGQVVILAPQAAFAWGMLAWALALAGVGWRLARYWRSGPPRTAAPAATAAR